MNTEMISRCIVVAEARTPGKIYSYGNEDDPRGEVGQPRYLLVADDGSLSIAETAIDIEEAAISVGNQVTEDAAGNLVDLADLRIYVRVDTMDAAVEAAYEAGKAVSAANIAEAGELCDRAQARAEKAERVSGLLQRRVNALRGALERLTRDWKFKRDSGGHRGFALRALSFDTRRFEGTITAQEIAEETKDTKEGAADG